MCAHGTKKVQGISLNIHELESDIDLDPLVFKDMINLKYLSIAEYFVDLTKKLNLPQGLRSLPDELRYLRWNHYPSRTLPSNFKPQNLVELHLRGSKLEKLWDGVQNFGSLKVLDLEESKNLIEFPNLSQALNVEKIYLTYCTSLEHLPSSVCKLKSLQLLRLNRCSKLEYLPEISEPMPYLRALHLSGSGIIDLPESIYNLIKIESLDLSYCQNLKSLPTSIWPMQNLIVIHLDGSGIRKLPTSLLENSNGIDAFSLRGCKNLELIPHTIYNKIHLEIIGCPKLKSLPRPLSSGTNLLQDLCLSGTSVSQIPNNLFSCLTSLSNLKLSRTNISRIPENIKFSKLRILDIRGCRFLQSLPELPLTIEKVDASGCTSLKMVSNLLTALTQPPTDRVNLGVTFSFRDCLKLEHQNLMSEFQMRASLIATEFALRKTLDKSRPPTTRMCYPGDNIPEWFSYQKKGRSINIRLPCNFNFMGFAFCFMFSRKEYYKLYGQEIYLCGEIYVKTFDGDERHLPLSLDLLPSNAKNYVSMTTCMCDVENFYSAVEMSFNFRTYIKIKRCGIRLLHVQDAMEFGIISSQYVCRKSNVVNDEDGPSLFWKSILEQLRYFQVSSSRKKLCEKIWSSNLKHRYKILWWRLLRDALPVGAALNHSTCPLCGSGDTSMESAIHLLLFCEKVRPLWFMSRWGLRTDSLCDFMASVLEIVLDRNYDRDFLIYASLLVETIWRATNELVYDGKEFHIAEIHSSVQDQFNQISTSKRKRKWRSLTLRKSCVWKPKKR
ncbi:hypothetical protein TIFTF001_030945 [Ficus carica]|uniref:Uncharacterized protein n=1 Tax=Ficus carica TaxID=3494 RepID=A0AA88J3J3_FICCA|nr:hypothetical protein TIFTF001_030945 [Ficus carica]